MLLLIGNIGTGEIVVIALVVLLLFGGKKIPELMRSLGRGVKSFRDGVNEVETELKKDFEEPDSNKTSSASSHPAGSSVPSPNHSEGSSGSATSVVHSVSPSGQASVPSASQPAGSSDNAAAQFPADLANPSVPSSSQPAGSSDNAAAPEHDTVSLSAPSSAPDEAQNASPTALGK